MHRSTLLALLLAACGAQGEPPALLPLDEIEAAIPPESTSPAEGLAARGASLQARAARLRKGTP